MAQAAQSHGHEHQGPAGPCQGPPMGHPDDPISPPSRQRLRELDQLLVKAVTDLHGPISPPRCATPHIGRGFACGSAGLPY